MKANEISSLLDRNEFYYGTLDSAAGQGEAFANFHVNSLDTNRMGVTLTHVSTMTCLASENITFKTSGHGFNLEAAIQRKGMHIGDAQHVVTGRVTEFAKSFDFEHSENKIVASTRFQYFAPLAPVLSGRSWADCKIDLYGIEIEMNEVPNTLEVQKDNVGIPIEIRFRESRIEFELLGEFEQSLTKARAMMDCLDKTLSLITEDRISWKRESILKLNAQRQQVGNRELLRWAVDAKGVNTDYHHSGVNLATTIQPLVRAIKDLSATDREFFEKVFTCFDRAWRAPYYELWLVIWHACLDLFKTHYGFDKQPFSPHLAKACQKAKVEFLDLFPHDLSKLLSGEEKFIFSEMRNDYLHKGFVIQGFDVTMDQIRRMRALSERFLLSFLGFDRGFCGLGEDRLH